VECKKSKLMYRELERTGRANELVAYFRALNVYIIYKRHVN